MNFHIDIACVWQKLEEQRPASDRRKIVRAAFSGIAGGDDQRCGQPASGVSQFIEAIDQSIEAQFEKVGRFSHAQRPLKVGAGKNYADDFLSPHAGRTAPRSSMRSTYLASRSNSRFTRSPGLAAATFVPARVWGMSQTAKLFAPSSATVRLIPSTAIDPLGAT